MHADTVVKSKELRDNPHLTWGEGWYIEVHEKMLLLKY